MVRVLDFVRCVCMMIFTSYNPTPAHWKQDHHNDGLVQIYSNLCAHVHYYPVRACTLVPHAHMHIRGNVIVSFFLIIFSVIENL